MGVAPPLHLSAAACGEVQRQYRTLTLTQSTARSPHTRCLVTSPFAWVEEQEAQ